MIDYVMTDQRWRSCTTNARSLPSAIVPNVFNDHNLVIGNFRMRFNVKKRARTKKLHIERLCNTEVKELYKTELKNHFEVLGNIIEESSLNDTLDIINGMIKKTAKEIIGFRRHKKAPWITDKVLALGDEPEMWAKKKKFEPR